MSFALIIAVTESLTALKTMLKKSPVMMQPRIRMLVAMKKAGERGISKRELMSSIGVSSQSVQTWRTSYKQGGMEALLQNSRRQKAGKPSLFTKEEHEKMERKLKDPANGLAGYIELQQWIAQAFQKEVKYNTILKYAVRHFRTSVKVARKSHVNKNEEATSAFKNTLLATS